MDTPPAPSTSDETGTRFEYFLLQARIPVGMGCLRLALENLGSGDRWNLGSVDDLGKILSELLRTPPPDVQRGPR